MKQILLSLFTLVSIFSSLAQTVKVNETDRKVGKVLRTGQAISLELDEKFVSKLWKKQIKDFGKSSKEGEFNVFEAGIIPSISTTPLKIITTVQGSGSHGTIVWMAVDMGSEWITANHSKYSTLEKILHDFGVKAYTEDINKDIEAAESALNKASKDYEKMKKEGQKLANNHKQNAEQKKIASSAAKKNMLIFEKKTTKKTNFTPN